MIGRALSIHRIHTKESQHDLGQSDVANLRSIKMYAAHINNRINALRLIPECPLRLYFWSCSTFGCPFKIMRMPASSRLVWKQSLSSLAHLTIAKTYHTHSFCG